MIRHAQASDESAVNDKDRKLTDLGKEEADRLGKRLASSLEKLGKVFLSPTARARETWQGIEKGAQLSSSVDVAEDPVIYAGAPESIVEAIRMESRGETVIVVGHEPTISETARLLAKPGIDTPNGMPTGSAVILSASDDWKEWHSHVADNAEFITAK